MAEVERRDYLSEEPPSFLFVFVVIIIITIAIVVIYVAIIIIIVAMAKKLRASCSFSLLLSSPPSSLPSFTCHHRQLFGRHRRHHRDHHHHHRRHRNNAFHQRFRHFCPHNTWVITKISEIQTPVSITVVIISQFNIIAASNIITIMLITIFAIIIIIIIIIIRFYFGCESSLLHEVVEELSPRHVFKHQVLKYFVLPLERFC